MPEKKIPKFAKPLRVLVVEDNQVDRKMLESMLTEKAEFTSFLKITKSLDEALRMLEEFEFEYTRTGVRYCAPVGLHDDGVCALALAQSKRRSLKTEHGFTLTFA